jgi:hypothetical protein
LDGDDIDPQAEARAYNYSIYLMVPMPYLLLGGMGLLAYRWNRSRPVTNSGSTDTGSSSFSG